MAMDIILALPDFHDVRNMTHPHICISRDQSSLCTDHHRYNICLQRDCASCGYVSCAYLLPYTVAKTTHTQSSLPNVMLSRFIINLRQIDTVSSDMFAEVTNERTPHFSDANFRMPSFGSILDNLGEPIASREEDGQNVETDMASTTDESYKRSEPSKAST